MKKIIISIIIIVVIIGAALGYFFAWRPSDASYTDALTQIDTLQRESNNINEAIKKITTPYNSLASDTISTLKASVKAYDTADDALAVSPVVSRDLTASSVYKSDKSDLASYRQAVSDLMTSLNGFSAVMAYCGNLESDIKFIQTTANFDTTAKDCTDAITAAKAAPDAAFNQQFLSDFLKKADTVVAAYKQLVAERSGTATAKQAAIDAANQASNNMFANRTAKLDLIITPTPTDDIQSLQSIITSQQGKFFR